MLGTISVDSVDVGGRLRSLDEGQVSALVASIAEVGLINPITVHQNDDGFSLVAGAHRLEAVKRLGLVYIEANIVDLGQYHRVIAECDENLVGSSLTESERGLFLARRKAAYEMVHPETKHGVAGGLGNRTDANLATVSFVKDTAAKTGMSERSIQRHAERGMKITDKALEALRGTTLDTGVYLDTLKDVPAKEQVGKVKADLVEEKKRLKKNRESRLRRDNKGKREAAVLRELERLYKVWQSVSPEARERFLSQISMDEAA